MEEKKWCREGIDEWTARWENSTKLRISTSHFSVEEAKSLANWILSSAPKRAYKITDTFTRKPYKVVVEVEDGWEYVVPQIEEVWE